MEDLCSKPAPPPPPPPKCAREYYVKLYFSGYQAQTLSSKESHRVRVKALKSWWSLSAAQQQQFVDKLNMIQEKYKENLVNYLKSVQPFMKRKIIREVHSDNGVSEPEISQEENHLQPPIDNSQDIYENISNEGSDQNNQNNAASAIDPDTNDPASSREIINGTEGISRIPEPTPPCTKNGKELFEMITNAMGGNNLEWKDLSQVERNKYQGAVLLIKREYIKQYQNYLESLPPIELFQHYNKTLEK